MLMDRAALQKFVYSQRPSLQDQCYAHNAHTYTGLYVGVVAPCSVLLAVDRGLVLPVAGVSPPGPGAVVLDGSGIRPGVHPGYTRPVKHAHVVIPDYEGLGCAVYR